MELHRRDAFRVAALLALVGVVAGCDDGDDAAPQETQVDLVASDLEQSVGDASAIGSAVSSLHALGADVFRAAAAQPGNVAISPYSIGVALAMAATGARGTTLVEMLDVISADDVRRSNGGLTALTRQLERMAGPVAGGREIALDAANAVFGQQGEAWQDDFLDALARDFGTGVWAVDFMRGTDAARAAINAWTADQTHDRIPEIIPEGALDALTRLVLVNALYFKAPWAAEFAVSDTADAEFHLKSGTVQVPMMHRMSPALGYARGNGWQSARLPYSGGELAMTILLPDPGGQDALIQLVASGGLQRILAANQPGGLVLALPRWEFRAQTPLGEILQSLGMVTAFDPDAADFSGMTTQERLFIGAVLHQTFIAVDEHGTEAAAATAAVYEAESGMVGHRSLVVDRPFLFVIHDLRHGTPLFIGRVADPRG